MKRRNLLCHLKGSAEKWGYKRWRDFWQAAQKMKKARDAVEDGGSERLVALGQRLEQSQSSVAACLVVHRGVERLHGW